MTTSPTRLVIDLTNLKLRPQGSAIGGVWLAYGDAAFPAQEWTDFVVVVLGWWADALIRLLKANDLDARVHFMDGPFAVDVSMVGPNRLGLRMINHSIDDSVITTAEAPFQQFVRELVTQSSFLLDECRLRKWWSQDADVLSARISDLHRELEDSSLKLPLR